MPGKSVKNWRAYHAMRDQGYSKRKSARIANSLRRRKRKR